MTALMSIIKRLRQHLLQALSLQHLLFFLDMPRSLLQIM